MGGGDLNLKKSWHPSTMKNMEKVWKAEQQDNEEKKKIAQLKRELELERDKEELISHAENHGVLDKKDENKLDWMYKGPDTSINRDEYLLGKPIDKAFEDAERARRDAEFNRAPKNHVEHECIPPSLRDFSGTEQIDLARKLQEDPLFSIKRKEIESRAQLLKNPVKLKQLKNLLEQQKKQKRSDKEKKKKKKSKNDSDEELNALLASKYKKLKGKVSAKDLLKNLDKKKRKKKKESSSSSSSDCSDSSDSSDDSDSDDKNKKKRKHRSPSPEKKKKSKRLEKPEKRSDERSSHKKLNNDHRDEKEYGKSREMEGKSRHRERNNDQNYRESHSQKQRDRSRSPRQDRDSRYRYSPETDRKFGLMKADGSKVSSSRRVSSPVRESRNSSSQKPEEKRWVPPKREKLSEEEKERRMREMMDNVAWRDAERVKNVQRYREEEKKNTEKKYNKDFMRKHLAVAAGSESLESRIKSKMHNIQRSTHAMDSNFARR